MQNMHIDSIKFPKTDDFELLQNHGQRETKITIHGKIFS